jgi:hypothetical protein
MQTKPAQATSLASKKENVYSVCAGGPREGSGGAEACAVREVATQDATSAGGKERLMWQ